MKENEDERKWVPLARKISYNSYNMLFLLQLASTSFRMEHGFSDGFHQEEKPLYKKNGFDQPENPFPLARMKDLVEIDVFTRQKKLPLSLNYTNDL